jgi:RNA polymerase sigma-70 factor, ECF subfamily
MGGPSTAGDITRLLREWGDGDASALEKLAPLVQAELARLARSYLRRERRRDLLDTSALINEAYLRLVKLKGEPVRNRALFFGLSARLMRNIIVDYARRRPPEPVGLEDAGGLFAGPNVDFVALDEALVRLAAFDPRACEAVEMRFFGGMELKEIAAALGVGLTAVKDDLAYAKSWLLKELS